MARNEKLHTGLLLLDPDGTAVRAELWMSGETAVAFERGTNAVIGTLHSAARSLDAEHRLVVTGDEGAWLCVDPEQGLGTWVGVTVRWPGEDPWETATVSWTNYRVRVAKVGQETRDLPGARTMMQGAQEWIQYGDLRIPVERRRANCGCGG